MGKSSPSSCLKIIVCGSDSADDDAIHSPEAKTSNDKRGWSFRKKSGRQRVLGNNVSSESTTFADKTTPQGGSIGFQAPIKSVSADEKPQLAKPVEEVTGTDKTTPQGGSIGFQAPIKFVSADEKPQLAKPVEEVTRDVATGTDSESKTSVVVVTSENDVLQAGSKVSLDEVAVKSVSNEPSAEDKMVDAVVAGNNSNQTVADNKMADASSISEYDSNGTSDETSVASESFVSKDDSTKPDEPRISESGMASEDSFDANVVMDESAVIIIQSAMRRFLAQRIFLQLQSAITLQAVIRGHLVRRNAVETLHCMRAIVKFQALVRARSSKSLGPENRPNDAQISTVKLLQNSFARQLLESTSKPKSLNIRCDPMKPNFLWGWLERWMSVSTPEAAEELEPSVEPESETENKAQETTMQADAEFPSVAISDSIDSKLNMVEGEEALENDENHIMDEVDNVNSSSASFPKENIIEQSHLQKQEIVNEDMESAKIEAAATEVSYIQAEPISLEDNEPGTQATELREPKLSMKRSASSELNDEGKKFVCGSRKASNPAFVAAHSKFEELTSASNSGKSIISSHQEVGAESHVESAPSSEESVKKATKPSDVEASGTFDPRVQVARSECGTEISVSSTLDSPDRFDIENAEAVREVQFLEETSLQPVVGEKLDCEADGLQSRIQQEEVHETNGVDPVVAEVSPQVEDKVETNASDVQLNVVPASSVTTVETSSVEEKHLENVHLEHEFNEYNVPLEHESTKADHQEYRSTPEASPISHRTAQESQGTPSSQASVKNKRNKVDKRGSNRKRSSPSSGKRSPSNLNVDSGVRSSTENLPKDHKSGKRRNSFGSTKSDNADQEPRDSSSRNPLPSYMQATESARAKANSPRSSPDVHDKEFYSKKRHSLPGATGRQVSPLVQRSAPQVAQGAKANGSHPSNERKWQR